MHHHDDIVIGKTPSCRVQQCTTALFVQYVLFIQLEVSGTVPGANVLNKTSTGHNIWRSLLLRVIWWCFSCVRTASTKNTYPYTRQNTCKTSTNTFVSIEKITCMNRNVFGSVLCGNCCFLFCFCFFQ